MANHPQPGPAVPEPASDPWHSAPLFEGGPAPTQPGPADGFGTGPYRSDPVGPQPLGQQPVGPGVVGPAWEHLGPPTPPRSGPSTTAVMLITAAAVVVVGGAAVGGYAVTHNNTTPSGLGASGTGTPTRSTGPTASASAAERDFLTVKVGECLENRSNDKDHPDMHLAACQVGIYPTYQLLTRYDGTTDVSKCNGVDRLTTKYHYELGDTKVVFCLRKLG